MTPQKLSGGVCEWSCVSSDHRLESSPLPRTRLRATDAVPLVAQTATNNPDAQVDFYVDGSWVGQAAAPPYEFAWQAAPPGQ
jgi:hypothetical protein